MVPSDAYTYNYFYVEFGVTFANIPAVVITPQQNGGQIGPIQSTYIANIFTDGFLMWTDGRAEGFNIQWVAIGEKVVAGQ